MKNGKFYFIRSEEKTATRDNMDHFIDKYLGSYYYGNDSIVPGINQTREWIEKDMERLLRERIQAKDVVHILAWKMGRIDYKKSTEKEGYKFTGDNSWCDDEKNGFMAQNRHGSFCINTIIQKAEEMQNDYQTKKSFSSWVSSEPIEALRRIRGDFGVDGIGSVYLITLLYFLSGGEYPIYDQFAMMALRAIDSGKKPGEKVYVLDLPDKNSRAFSDLLSPDLSEESIYQEYIRLLNKYFGDRYKTDRNIDRALWVYGHLFINEKE